MPAEPTPDTLEAQARQWAMLAHISALSGLVTGIGYVGGPLLVWFLKKDEFALVDHQAKEALNFNLSMLIYWGVCALGALLGPVACLTVPVAGVLWFLWLIFTIVGGLRANEGKRYIYPMSLRFFE